VAAAGIVFCAWLLATRSSTQLWLLLMMLAAGFAARACVGRWPSRAAGSVR
jgi:hypothetical protein